MRDYFRWQIIKHFSKFGYSILLYSYIRVKGWDRNTVDVVLGNKLCKARETLVSNIPYAIPEAAIAKIPANAHVTRKNFCGRIIYYIHNDTALTVFYGKNCLTLIRPRIADICYKTTELISKKQDDYYGKSEKYIN